MLLLLDDDYYYDYRDYYYCYYARGARVVVAPRSAVRGRRHGTITQKVFVHTLLLFRQQS